MKVSVLGAGGGAYTLAFHLVQMGHDVLMYTPKTRGDLQPVIETGCIEAVKEFNGVVSELFGSSSITMVTTNIKEAMSFSSIIMLTIPSFAQKSFFKDALPFLTEQHVFISLPGNFAFIDYVQLIKQHTTLDVTADLPFTLVETSTIPYVCRRIGGNQIFINGVKRELQIGVYPSCRTSAIMEKIKTLFTLEMQVQPNLLAVGLCNLNLLLHPPVLTYNAGWVEATNGEFFFYNAGATKGILSLMNSLDQERLTMAKAMDFNLNDLLKSWKGWYGDKKASTLVELIANAYWYQTVKAPSTLHHRYYTEDLSYVLIPLVEYFEEHFSVKCPVANAIITSARHLTGLELQNERNFNMFPRDFKEL